MYSLHIYKSSSNSRKNSRHQAKAQTSDTQVRLLPHSHCTLRNQRKIASASTLPVTPNVEKYQISSAIKSARPSNQIHSPPPFSCVTRLHVNQLTKTGETLRRKSLVDSRLNSDFLRQPATSIEGALDNCGVGLFVGGTVCAWLLRLSPPAPSLLESITPLGERTYDVADFDALVAHEAALD